MDSCRQPIGQKKKETNDSSAPKKLQWDNRKKLHSLSISTLPEQAEIEFISDPEQSIDKWQLVNQRMIDRTTVLCFAVMENNYKAVQLLLNNKANPNQRLPSAHTPLHIAAENGHHEIVKLLLNEGKADANQAMPVSGTPLSIATEEGHLEVVKLLLNEGKADANQATLDGATPLIKAAYSGNLEIARLLITEGKANVNHAMATNRRPTSLLYAAEQGHYEIVKLLLASRADHQITDTKGFTALQVAKELKHHQIVKLLESQQSSANTKGALLSTLFTPASSSCSNSASLVTSSPSITTVSVFASLPTAAASAVSVSALTRSASPH